MAHDTHEHREVVHSGSNGIAWLALILAIIALILGWVAFNRSGTDLGEEIQQEGQEALTEFDIYTERLQAAATLAAIEARYNLEEELDEASQELTESLNNAEAELEQAYRKAGREASEEWRDLQANFDQVEANIRDGSADAVASFENLIEALRRDIRTDEE